MTKKLFALVGVLLLVPSSYVFSTIVSNPAAHYFTQEAIELLQKSPEEFRAIAPENPDHVQFSAHAFDGSNFFLGALSADATTYALARAYLDSNTTVTPPEPICRLKNIAPATAFVNRAKETDAAVANPLYNATISQIALSPRLVVAVNKQNPAYQTAFPATSGNNQLICLVEDANAGTSLFVNTVKLNDAKDPVPAETSGIAAISAVATTIVAAVAPNGKDFGQPNSGLAILTAKNNQLTPVDATSGNDGNKAVDVLNAIVSGGTVDAQTNVCMYWDATLSRLFVGFVAKATAGGKILSGVLVGQFSGTSNLGLTLNQMTTLNVAGSASKIVTTGSDTANYAAIYNLKTMHTSTKKTYLIVNGDVANDPNDVKVKVYALSLVNPQTSNTTDMSASIIGTLASKTDSNQKIPAATVDDLPNNTDVAAIIGGGDAPAVITDMFTVGDAVFVCCADNTGAPTKGIFQSTALFDASGLIKGWTPWQRVMGAADQVYGAAFDNTYGNYWYLTKDANPGDIIKVTQWGYGAQALLGKLEDFLYDQFPFDNAGIHQMFNFNELTPSFNEHDFSMMVATGYQKVALIQTGQLVSGAFTPVAGADFDTPANYVTIYNDDVIKSLGPICSADVAPYADTKTPPLGYLFVGGYNGLAVLSDPDGKGWTNLNNVKSANIGDDLYNFTFKPVGDFKNVRKLVHDSTNLYILTPKTLYRLKTSDFSITPIYQATTEYLLDFVVGGKLGILAKSTGLFRSANDKDVSTDSAADLLFTTEITGQVIGDVTTTQIPLGPVTHIFPLSLNKANFNYGGMIYVVAGNISHDLSTIYRFSVTIDPDVYPDVTNDTVQPITEPLHELNEEPHDYFYPMSEFRSSFVTDGAMGLHTLPLHFGRTDFLRKCQMISLPRSVAHYDVVIPIETDSSTYYIGNPVRNTASGAWIIPGDWGIQVNE